MPMYGCELVRIGACFVPLSVSTLLSSSSFLKPHSPSVQASTSDGSPIKPTISGSCSLSSLPIQTPIYISLPFIFSVPSPTFCSFLLCMLDTLAPYVVHSGYTFCMFYPVLFFLFYSSIPVIML